MFFIPIAAIFFFFWFILQLFMAFNQGKMEYEYKKDSELTKRLELITRDDYLENQLGKQLTPNESDRVMYQFLGDSSDWDFYIRNANRKECAKLITMAKLGKLPHMFVWSLGDYLRIDNLQPPDQVIKCQIQNEKFLLRIEDLLRSKGVNAILLFQQQSGVEKQPWKPFRQYLEEHGHGFTNGATTYRFTYDNRRVS